MNKNNLYRKEPDQYREVVGTIKEENDSRWFYKKLDIAAAGTDLDLEKKLEQKMAEERDRYRIRHERMQEPFLPAEPFYKARPAISESPVYRDVFRKMPKGGLLHVHGSAGLSVDGLIRLLKSWCDLHSTGDLCMYVVTRENAVQHTYAVGTLMYQCQFDRTAMEDYVEPLYDYLKDPYDTNWLKELLSFGSDRILQHPYRWDEFNTIFSRTSRLFRCQVFYKAYHKAFFEECLADKINYVELRCGFEDFETPQSAALSDIRLWEQMNPVPYQHYTYAREMELTAYPWEQSKAFLETIVEAMREVNSGRTQDDRIDVRVILCARRALDPERELDVILSKVDSAIVLQAEVKVDGKPLVIGFDFVSEEDRGISTQRYAERILYSSFGEGYTPPFMAAYEKQLTAMKRKYGTGARIGKIDFYLHDGESNWNSNTNVIDASVASQYRIGHGFNMNKHPGCVRGITMTGTAPSAEVHEPVLEICPISNQLLGYYPDLRNHSAYQLMKEGIGCCLCSDDPQLFGNEGLSYDFWEAYMGMGLSLDAVKGMVYIAYYFSQARGKGITDEAVIKASFKDLWHAFLTEAAPR